MQVEVCIESIQEAKLAAAYNCDRIEVCSALDLGGLTPSYSLIKRCSEIAKIEAHILIRPRPGSFVYSPDELNLMLDDIRLAAQSGAKGVVFGCLNNTNELDIQANKQLLKHAQEFNLQSTFHRAIDFVNNYDEAFELIIQMGFDRILTSGQQSTAFTGIKRIHQLIKQSEGKIQIMAGSGIDADNVRYFIEIGVDAVHFSIRKLNDKKLGLSMGMDSTPNEEKLKNIIRKIKQ